MSAVRRRAAASQSLQPASDVGCRLRRESSSPLAAERQIVRQTNSKDGHDDMSLPVSIQDVVMAIDLPDNDCRSYLNTDTGEIVTATDEDRRLVENMEDFGTSLADDRHRSEVLEALRGRGAFRMFKSTVHRLGIEQDWCRHRDAAFERIAKAWLEANGVAYR